MHRSLLKHISFSVILIILALAAMPIPSAKAAGEIITSTETGGLWSDGSTWVGGVAPDGIDDSVVIATTDGAVVTLGSATTVKGSLTINAGSELATGSSTLTLEGDFVNNGTFDAGSHIVIAGAAATQNIAGFTTSGNVSMTKTSGTATFTSNVIAAGLTLNGAGGTLNLGTGRSHRFTGAWTRTAGTLDGGSSIIRVDGTVSGTGGTFTPGTSTFTYGGAAQNVAAVTYHNLKFQTAGVKTALGDITTNGYLRIESGSNFTVGAFNLTVAGNTYLTGTLTLSSATGAKTFNGLVTVNPGGTWSNSTGNADVHFRGGLMHNGSAFNAGTGMYYFETNDQSLGGSSALTIPNVTIEVGRTLTNNSSGGLTVTTWLTGGSVTQGASGVLNLSLPDGSCALTALNASAIGNTINYGYAGAQDVKDIQYHNLTLSGSSAKTLPVGLTHLTGNLSLSGTATATTVANLDVDGNLSISGGATLTVGAFDFNVDGTTSITGTSTSVNGKLSYSNATGAKSHVGAVTIGLNGFWDNSTGNSAVTFQNGLSFSGKTFNGGTGAYTFQTSPTQSIGGTVAFTIPNLVVDTGVDLTNNNTGGLTVTTSLTGAGTLTQGASATLNLGMGVGSFTLTNLVASASGNTVNYNGATQTIRPITYHHLTLSSTSAKVISGLSTVNGNFTISGTASATTDTALTVGGNLAISAVGANLFVGPADFTVNGTTTVTGILTHNSEIGAKTYVGLVTISGTWSNSGDADFTFRGGLNGTITSGNAGVTATYTFDTTAAQIIDGTIAVVNINVGSGVTLTNDGSITISGNLGGLGTWMQGTTGILILNGTMDITTLNASSVGNTVKYTQAVAGAQTVRGITYHHLEIGGGNLSAKTLEAGLTNVNGNLTLSTSGTTATLAAGLTVGGNVTINTGTTLDVSASNFPLNVGGGFTGSGTFTPQLGTVTMQGSASQAINNNATAPFYNLIINNAAGVTLSKDITVNNSLTLTNGKITTSTRFVIIGTAATIVGADATRYVIGNLRKMFPTSGSPQLFTYPIGDATNYTPVDISVNNVTTAGGIAAKTTTTAHTAIGTITGYDVTKDVNRYWTLTPVTIVFSNYDATFNFVPGDVDGGANTANFGVKNYYSSAWHSATVGTRTATSTQVLGAAFVASNTVFDFLVGEVDDVAPTVTSVSSTTANGSYNAGDVISGITVTFSEAVNVTGTPQLTLETGTNDAVLTYSGGTGTNTLTFSNYTVAAGDTSADLDSSLLSLNGGTIEDLFNNPATLTLSGVSLAVNKAIVIDTTAPNTSIVSNPSLLTNSASSPFTFSSTEAPSTFECKMDAGAFTACTSPASFTLGGGSHTFQVRAIDAAGNVDATPASYTWTIDLTGPTVVSSVFVHPNPTNRATVQFTVTFSEAVTGVNTTDFSLTLVTVTGASVTTVTGSGTTYTVTVNTGSGNGTIKLNVLDDNTIKDAAQNPQNGAYVSGQTYTVNKTLTYNSVGGNDGWTLESTATSSKGGTFNATNTTFFVGDDTAKKQYRGILHFDTSNLPDTAVITSVVLKMQRAATSGNISTLSALLADMHKPSFGTAALAKTDFEATAGRASIFNAFSFVSPWYSATMKSTGFTYVNRTGTTQFRIRFTKGDDADGVADNLQFYSGNHATVGVRPTLIITYYVP
ncbi:MAG: hypothetical protein HY867_02740 [Chloroflexi bacterium]|nr:hypothetical protein [Chloroflexota bacterium]